MIYDYECGTLQWNSRAFLSGRSDDGNTAHCRRRSRRPAAGGLYTSLKFYFFHFMGLLLALRLMRFIQVHPMVEMAHFSRSDRIAS